MKFKKVLLLIATIGSLSMMPAAFATNDDDDVAPQPVPEGGSLAGVFALTVLGVGVASWSLKRKKK